MLLEIDLQGARQVRAAIPDAHFVFLAPPSCDEIVRRLVGRGTETAEERERRLKTAKVELAAARSSTTRSSTTTYTGQHELVHGMGFPTS